MAAMEEPTETGKRMSREGAAAPSDDFSAEARVRLAAHLGVAGFDFDPNLPIERFSGGLANRNYRIIVDGRPVVLRRPPDGPLPPGAHDMAREHRILSRLSDALSFIPRGLHLCDDLSVIGVPFQLIEYRPGLVVKGDDTSALPATPDVPGRLCAMMIETLAALHAVDPAEVGLDGLGKPAGFVARAIAGWAKRGALVANGTRSEQTISAIAEWLSARSFGERSPTLLHCDFKLDNLILDPATLEPAALVDWDMGTRGDPLFDLATLLSYWSEAGDPAAMLDLRQMPTARPGFWSRDEAAARYAEVTGRPIADLHAMLVLARLKLGVVFLQLHQQWVNGAVDDPRYEGFGPLGHDLIAFAEETRRQTGDAS